MAMGRMRRAQSSVGLKPLDWRKTTMATKRMALRTYQRMMPLMEGRMTRSAMYLV